MTQRKSDKKQPIDAGALDIRAISRMLPHRYPFLLVDRVEGIEVGKKVVAVKNVTANEPFFPGHFPGNPIMPGVLIVEAMAQAAAILGVATHPEYQDGGVLLMGLDKVRFRRPVVPGDTLNIEINVDRVRGAIWKLMGVARVAGAKVAEAEILATFYREEE